MQINSNLVSLTNQMMAAMVASETRYITQATDSEVRRLRELAENEIIISVLKRSSTEDETDRYIARNMLSAIVSLFMK